MGLASDSSLPAEQDPSPRAKQRGFRISRLRRLGFKDYEEYLRSPVWREVRSRYRASGRQQDCLYCGDPRTLLHHLTYERVGGDELLSDLVPLCDDCHALVHRLERLRLVRLEDTAGLADAGRAARYATAPGSPVASERDRLLTLFLARPLHRQIAALRAVQDRAQRLQIHSGLSLRREFRVIQERTARALRKLAVGTYPDNDLRVIEGQIRQAIQRLERNTTSGPETLSDLLTAA